MPKETFGGGDDGEPPPSKKKLQLDRFNLSPDTNIRDVFWSIMGSYAAAKKPGMDLKELEHDRVALMRIALSIISARHSGQYGLTPRFVSMYSLMMMLDAGWLDELRDFLARAAEDRQTSEPMAYAVKRLIPDERYGEGLSSQIALMVRARDTSEAGLALAAAAGSEALAQSLKKELVIIARGDVGDNQLNAIKSLSLIKEDEAVKRSLIALLSHWDAPARMAAAQALSLAEQDQETKSAASKRLESEPDSRIRKLLKRIAE